MIGASFAYACLHSAISVLSEAVCVGSNRPNKSPLAEHARKPQKQHMCAEAKACAAESLQKYDTLSLGNRNRK